MGHATESSADLTLDRELSGEWHATFSGNLSTIRQLENSSTLAAPTYPFYGPTEGQLVANSSIAGIDALSSGPVFMFFGGPAKASLGSSFRAEQFKSYEFTTSPMSRISRRPMRMCSAISGKSISPRALACESRTLRPMSTS